MPKGYNDKAIRGLLMFVEGCFEVVEERKQKEMRDAFSKKYRNYADILGFVKTEGDCNESNG